MDCQVQVFAPVFVSVRAIFSLPNGLPKKMEGSPAVRSVFTTSGTWAGSASTTINSSSGSLRDEYPWESSSG